MKKYEQALDKSEKEIEWSNDKCDKYDYMIAAFCGMMAGIVDALFVGAPGQGKLGQLTDKGADQMVQKIAKMLWNGDGRSTIDGKPRNAPATLEQAISYLEQSFPVNYDARYVADVLDADGNLSSMRPQNHHIMSLAHSPDIIGLLFSILDQFTGKASFIDNGKIIRVIPVRDPRNNKVMYMQGTNIQSKLFCGVCNWLGHLMSDLCGSSSTRRAGKTGRGAGLPIPFYELFLLMDFGDFDGKTFADIAVKVFEEGYDLRHGVAMAIPVMISELSIKIIWALKRHFYLKKGWKECIPSNKHADLRIMLLIGNGALCLIDGVDAAIRTGLKGGNLITFILHLNLVAWGRLIILIFRELSIRYGNVVKTAVLNYLSEIGLNDAFALNQYYERMEALDQKLNQALKDFVVNVENEYKMFMNNLNKSLNPVMGTPEQRRIASVEFARNQKVNENRIMHSADELRMWLEDNKK